MRRPPRNPRERLFSLQMVAVSLLLGATTLIAVCLGYAWVVQHGATDAEARSFGFAAIVFGNLAMIHATRSRDMGLIDSLRSSNPALWWVTAATVGALLGAIYIAPAAEVFRFGPLPAGSLTFAAATGVIGVLWYEIYKLLRRRAPAVNVRQAGGSG